MWALAVLILSLWAGVATASPQPDSVAIETARVCGAALPCAEVPVRTIDPAGKLLTVTARVRLAGPVRPRGLFIDALAASQVYWDGRLIGGNGRPSRDPRLEVPGRRDAVVAIPPDLAGEGWHTLRVDMSSGRSPVRFSAPVHSLVVGPFADPRDRALRAYLPSMLTGGGLLVAALYFGVGALLAGRRPPAPWLAGAALFAAAQLVAEASRAFWPYAYPEHIVRVGLILACAAGFSLCLAGYAAGRFLTRNRHTLLAGQTILTLATAILAPGFDAKTSGVIACGVAFAVIAAIFGAFARRPGAMAVFAPLAVFALAWMLLDRGFLDRDFYLAAMLLFAALFLERGLQDRRLRLEAQAHNQRLQDQLADLSAPPLLALGSGGSRRLLRASEIVRIASADDYAEVFPLHGRPLLHPEPLRTLMARLPAVFLRAHRGHLVNLDHVIGVEREAGARVLSMRDGARIPVSRRQVPALVRAFAERGVDFGERTGSGDLPHRAAR